MGYFVGQNGTYHKARKWPFNPPDNPCKVLILLSLFLT